MLKFITDRVSPGAILLAPTLGQDIVADHAHTALTLPCHPLALLRERFAAMHLKTAAQVNAARHRHRHLPPAASPRSRSRTRPRRRQWCT